MRRCHGDREVEGAPGEAHFAQFKARGRDPTCTGVGVGRRDREEEGCSKDPGLDKHIDGPRVMALGQARGKTKGGRPGTGQLRRTELSDPFVALRVGSIYTRFQFLACDALFFVQFYVHAGVAFF